MVFIVSVSGLLEQNVIRLPIPYELNVLKLNFKKKATNFIRSIKVSFGKRRKMFMKSFDGLNNLRDTF